MTYCLGIKVNEGMIFASDSRTNAGLDDFSVHSKMFNYSVGDRCVVILTSGNLSTSQAVFHSIESDLESAVITDRNLNICKDLEEVADYVGSLSAKHSKIKYEVSEHGDIDFGSYFIVGGQIQDQSQKMFLIYPQGNFIECSENNPFFQIGETKYGKPILDRLINLDISLGDAARAALVSLDSTMRSDLSVGPPIDFLVYKKDKINLDIRDKIRLDSPYFKDLSDMWHDKLQSSFQELPKFDWE